MKKEHKGCLFFIGFVAVCSAGIYIALKMEWLFFKNLLFLLPAIAGPYIGEKYFREQSKRTPLRRWALYFAIICLIAGVLTWWMKSH